jgi:hypothetical protein
MMYQRVAAVSARRVASPVKAIARASRRLPRRCADAATPPALAAEAARRPDSEAARMALAAGRGGRGG